MSQLMNPFNPLQHDPTQGGGSWPLGKHPVIITAAEVKPTNDNNSGKLVFSLKVIDGPNAGFEGQYNLNLYNQSAKAAEIAHRQLSAVCHVTQTFQLGPDGTQLQYLFNKPFVVECGYQKGDGPVGPENPDNKGYTEIKRVFDINGNEPGKQGTPQASSQPAQGFNQQAPQQNNGGFQQPAQGAPQGGNGGANAWGGQQGGQGDAGQQGAQNGGGWGGNNGTANGPAPAQNGQQGGWGAQGGNGAGAPSERPAWGQR